MLSKKGDPAMILYLSLLVAFVGVLMYALAANPKLVEIGRIMFWTGLLAFLLDSVPRLVGVVR
jgi:Na+/phosphate symporter